jgi:hypothetical protein
MAIFPEFRWKTESIAPAVGPLTRVSRISGYPYSVDTASRDSWLHVLTATLTADQRAELIEFWSDNRGKQFDFRWGMDDETYHASFNARPVSLPVGNFWRCRVTLNRGEHVNAGDIS